MVGMQRFSALYHIWVVGVVALLGVARDGSICGVALVRCADVRVLGCYAMKLAFWGDGSCAMRRELDLSLDLNNFFRVKG